MSKIICNITSSESRVALLENRLLTELFIERKAEQGIVGNIYKGKVTKVLPGIQVAFVDVGLPRAGFLYVSDIGKPSGGVSGYMAGGEGGAPHDEEVEMEGAPNDHGAPKIEDILREGSELMVQVSKNPMGAKGARITCYVTIPGRYLVFMPGTGQVGVSRRIEGDAEKKRLRDIVRRLKKNSSGYIIRTAAEGRDEADLAHDIEFLDKLWASITSKYETAPTPSLLYHDLNIIQRSIRDLFNKDVTSVVIDDRDEFERAVAFCESYLPEISGAIEQYTAAEPIFDAHGIEIEIERALGRRVWLKSGGYIVIDQTEALTAIDVNTGKFVGKHNQEETILKTNLEAVKEIVYQLRLRNLGGLIIIDFIDMEREESKEKVYSALNQALRGDRSRTNILKISELGLVEMTRKRVRDSLSRTLTTVCPYCDGRGVVKSTLTVLYELYREIRRVASHAPGGEKKIICEVSPGVAELLFEEESAHLDHMEEELDVEIVINPDAKLHQERFEVKAV
ncbi:MAG: Rne/Rng family ribonuclease [Nitrospinae bacterium]|nr:Rne/Rng family ribonuclease [Nitrospinota bacterium]